MDDDNRPRSHDNRIIIRRVTRNEETGATEEEIFRASQPGPAGRWLTYLLLVPVLIVMLLPLMSIRFACLVGLVFCFLDYFRILDDPVFRVRRLHRFPQLAAQPPQP